ncbi:hypothetical protein OIU77_021841 [Salix suchowensis]|uniref:Uncharacterized protein n=1 Tax=Salix suchowensis TaxID=1278906 RepID=A0ABQ9CB61_9ROSI|nr:hypothetical protein OIU77_021841 [Salix suchowensis]
MKTIQKIIVSKLSLVSLLDSNSRMWTHLSLIGFSLTRINELANLVAWILEIHVHGEVVEISSAGQGSGNLGIDISLCNGAAGERKVVDGGEIGGGISWTNFSAAMAIPVVCLELVDLVLAVDIVVAVTVTVLVVEPAPDLGTGDVNGLVVEMMVLEKDWVLTMVAELGTAVVEMAASVIEVVQVLMQGSVPVMVLEVVALVAELVLHLVMAMVAMKGVGDEPAIVGGSGSSSVGGGEPTNGTGDGSGSNENNIPALGPFSTGSILHTSELPKQWCLWRNCCIYFDYHFN